MLAQVGVAERKVVRTHVTAARLVHTVHDSGGKSELCHTATFGSCDEQQCGTVANGVDAA